MTCPRCRSENVTAQVVSETALVKKHRGLLWWLFIGWWWWIVDLFLWLFLTIPRLIVAIFRPRRYKTKTLHRSMWVCQACGHHWRAQ